jgi:small-conductance mechanosensitive channel
VEGHAHREDQVLTLTALLHSEAPWLAIVAMGFTFLLIRAERAERPVFLNTLWLFLAGVLGQGLAVVLDAADFPRASAAAYGVFRFVAAVACIRLAGFALFRLVLPLAGQRPPRLIEDLAIIVAYVAFGFFQLRLAGLDLGSIVTTSAILTAVLAFAMQDTLGNMLGGIAIQLDNSVKVGDWIRVDDQVGRVVDIRWRSTLIETRNWETVIIPNSVMMKSRVAIIGKREGEPLQWRRILNFMVDPGVPPARVIAIVDDEMRELSIPNVARTPAPSCVLKRFEEGNLCYQLRYFLTDLLEDDLTDSMVRVHLFASLQRAGIRVAEPQRTVHAVTRDEAHAEKVRRRELTRGDIMTKQGNKAHWLYILAYGEAEVIYEPPGGVSQVIGSLHAGEFFGEMALISGEARAATVVAKTDVECYRLDRASFQELLLGRAEIAEQIKRVMGGRRGDLDSARQAFDGIGPVAEAEVRLATRIRRFFGMRA